MRIGFDIGGTFTDVIVVGDDGPLVYHQGALAA